MSIDTDFAVSLLSLLPIGINLVDTTGTVVFANRYIVEQCDGDVVGKKCWDIYRDDQQQCHHCPLLNGWSGQQSVVESNGVFGGRCCEIHHTSFHHQGQDLVLEVFLDITERKKAIARTALLDAATSEGILVHENGVILDVNAAFAQMHGYTREELIGKNGIDLLVADDSREEVLQHVRSGSDVPYRIWQKRKDGSCFPSEIHSKTVAANSKSYRTVLIRDITENHKIEEVKQNLVSIVSHEINQPLAAMRLAAENCKDGVSAGSTETLKESLEIVVHNVDRLSKLVRDMLSITQLEAAKLHLTLTQFDLSICLHSIILQTKELARVKGVTIVASEHCNQPHPISADPDKIEEVLMNLVTNACYHTGAGGRIELGVIDSPDAVEVRVTDTGIGIAKEDLSRLFSWFGRVGSCEQRAKGGTGLGLFICKQLVEMHGGTIGVSSELGKGSIFYFKIPKVSRSSVSTV